MIILHLCMMVVASGIILSESQVEQCYQQDDLKCAKKLLVSMTIENGQMAATESIQITQTSNGTILETPITITLTKSPVLALYPLKYVQDLNSQPLEQIIASTILNCKDEAYTAEPTCGWQLDAAHKQIPDSQGYCCACSFAQIVGVDTENLSRGNICSAFNLGTGSATAHCLRYSNLWYSAFSISMYQIYYELQVSIKMNDTFTQNLTLGTSKYVAQTSELIVRLVGDFSPSSPPQTFDAVYLLKPSMPVTDARVQEGSRAWMFVPQVMVGLDAQECNKIGVGYTAFRNQANACSNPVGSCLRNQIENLYQSDLALITKNLTPQYLLSSQGTFKQVTDATQTYLMQEIQGKMPTLVTLEIDADAVRFIVNVGQGRIDVAQVKGFEAHSANGLLLIQITNTGQIPSEFQTSITCSSEVNPIQGGILFLEPLQSKSFTDRLDVTADLGANHSCVVSLYNNLGTLLDAKHLNFTTTDMLHQNLQNNDTSTTSASISSATQPVPPPSASCETICPNFWDMVCFFQVGCSQQLYKIFSILIVLLLFLMLCCALFRNRKVLCKKKKRKQKYIGPILPNSIYQQPVEPRTKYLGEPMTMTIRPTRPSRLVTHPRVNSCYLEQSITLQPSTNQHRRLRQKQVDESIVIQQPQRFRQQAPQHSQINGEVQLLYANLMVGGDELATQIGQNLSIPLIGYMQGTTLSRLKLDETSQVHRFFKSIYGRQWRGRLVEYLEALRQEGQFTTSPLFLVI